MKLLQCAANPVLQRNFCFWLLASNCWYLFMIFWCFQACSCWSASNDVFSIDKLVSLCVFRGILQEPDVNDRLKQTHIDSSFSVSGMEFDDDCTSWWSWCPFLKENWGFQLFNFNGFRRCGKLVHLQYTLAGAKCIQTAVVQWTAAKYCSIIVYDKETRQVTNMSKAICSTKRLPKHYRFSWGLAVPSFTPHARTNECDIMWHTAIPLYSILQPARSWTFLSMMPMSALWWIAMAKWVTLDTATKGSPCIAARGRLVVWCLLHSHHKTPSSEGLIYFVAFKHVNPYFSAYFDKTIKSMEYRSWWNQRTSSACAASPSATVLPEAAFDSKLPSAVVPPCVSSPPTFFVAKVYDAPCPPAAHLFPAFVSRWSRVSWARISSWSNCQKEHAGAKTIAAGVADGNSYPAWPSAAAPKLPCVSSHPFLSKPLAGACFDLPVPYFAAPNIQSSLCSFLGLTLACTYFYPPCPSVAFPSFATASALQPPLRCKRHGSFE